MATCRCEGGCGSQAFRWACCRLTKSQGCAAKEEGTLDNDEIPAHRPSWPSLGFPGRPMLRNGSSWQLTPDQGHVQRVGTQWAGPGSSPDNEGLRGRAVALRPGGVAGSSFSRLPYYVPPLCSLSPSVHLSCRSVPGAGGGQALAQNSPVCFQAREPAELCSGPDLLL